MQPEDRDAPWRPKFIIDSALPIATAGVGFAKHMTSALKAHGFNLLNLEPPPPGLPGETARRFGYLRSSARFGAIATPRQLVQLIAEAFTGEPFADCVEAAGSHFRDAYRPMVEPYGLAAAEHVLAHRRQHLARVRSMVLQAKLLIFTLGRPDVWVCRETRHLFPQGPAGGGAKTRIQRTFDPEATGRHLSLLREVLRRHSPDLRLLLSVEPPDAALHAAVQQFAQAHADTDYLPGADITEMVHSFFRSARAAAPRTPVTVETPKESVAPPRRARKRRERKDKEEIVCEEILLDAFSR